MSQMHHFSVRLDISAARGSMDGTHWASPVSWKVVHGETLDECKSTRKPDDATIMIT